MNGKRYLKRVLVVDDDKIVQLAMRTMLAEMGCEVDTADNGLDALNQLKNATFDLVCSDINMPKMDGFGLAKSIRLADTPFQKIPIIAISSCVDPVTRKRARRSGINALFKKPINVALLKDTIKQVAAWK